MICTHCKAEVTRFITKGPYCSVACKDHYEDDAEIAARDAEIEQLRGALEQIQVTTQEWRTEKKCEDALGQAVLAPTAPTSAEPLGVGIMDKIAARLANEREPHCGVCGGPQVFVRGKHPGMDRRLVCPQCCRARLDTIHDMSSPDYGIAHQEGGAA